MTQKRAALLVLVVLIGLVIALPGSPRDVQAQGDDSTPIYFLMNGDIWLYTPATGILEQGSTWGYNEKPVMSPDGSQFAYTSLATVGVDHVNSGGFLFDPRPTNIWIWGPEVEEAYRLADQPANAALSNEGAQNIIRRSSLAWSPDGSQLAWVELGDNFDFQLVIHDFEQNSTRNVPAELPIPFGDGGFIGAQKLAWGPGGIAVENFAPSVTPNPNQQGPFFETTISIFNPVTGDLLSNHVLGGENDQVVHFYWIDTQTLGLFFYSGESAALNIANSSVSPMTTTELISLQAPGSVSVQVGSVIAQNSLRRNWTIVPDEYTFQTNDIVDRVTLSPSGHQVAWLDDALYVWSQEGVTRVAGTEGVADEHLGGLAWGATGWRLAGTRGIYDCSNAPAPRLVLGGNGAVIPGLGANALRDHPGQSAVGSEEIGTIPPDGVFIVMAGPECASGFNWWQVNYNGQVGWTAEGEGDTYWLEPR